MVRSEILNNLWNPVAEAQEKALKGDPVMEKTITIGQVNPCIYSYVHMKPLLGLFMKGNGHFSKWCDTV